jgi:DNA sulfur modification protein DndD
MQLALYGKNVKSTRGRLPYAEYLLRSINRYVSAKEGAGLQLAFRHRSDGREDAIRLIRTWCQQGGGIKDSFEVWRGGAFDSVATERWSEFVEDFMPIQILDLFFSTVRKLRRSPIRNNLLRC